MPDDFVARLFTLCATSAVARTLGVHRCRLAPCDGARTWPPLSVEVDGHQVQLGGAEIRVGDDTGTWYAPDLIAHYVTVHRYRPPEEFIEALAHGRVMEEDGRVDDNHRPAR